MKLSPQLLMSDPRFTKLKTDPRFRRPKKHQSKAIVDERFKSIFDHPPKKTGKDGMSDRVKFFVPLSHVHR